MITRTVHCGFYLSGDVIVIKIICEHIVVQGALLEYIFVKKSSLL